jgi:hypothetical protein
MRNNRWISPAMGRVTVAAMASLLLLTACAGRAALKPSSWHLPWRKAPVAAPVPVVELRVQSDSGTPITVLQYWMRDTLRVDLSAVGGSGSLKLLPSPVNGWPPRMEFAVRAGSITQLEVQGDQRAVFAVSAATSDGAPQTLPVSPSVYSPATAAITVSWN